MLTYITYLYENTVFSKTNNKIIDDKGVIVFHFCKSFFLSGLIEDNQISTLLPYLTPGNTPHPVASGKAHCPVVGKIWIYKGNHCLCIIVNSNMKMDKSLKSKEVRLRRVCCSHHMYTGECRKWVSHQENKLWKTLLEIY